MNSENRFNTRKQNAEIIVESVGNVLQPYVPPPEDKTRNLTSFTQIQESYPSPERSYEIHSSRDQDQCEKVSFMQSSTTTTNLNSAKNQCIPGLNQNSNGEIKPKQSKGIKTASECFREFNNILNVLGMDDIAKKAQLMSNLGVDDSEESSFREFNDCINRVDLAKEESLKPEKQLSNAATKLANLSRSLYVVEIPDGRSTLVDCEPQFRAKKKYKHLSGNSTHISSSLLNKNCLDNSRDISKVNAPTERFENVSDMDCETAFLLRQKRLYIPRNLPENEITTNSESVYPSSTNVSCTRLEEIESLITKLSSATLASSYRFQPEDDGIAVDGLPHASEVEIGSTDLSASVKRSFAAADSASVNLKAISNLVMRLSNVVMQYHPGDQQNEEEISSSSKENLCTSVRSADMTANVEKSVDCQIFTAEDLRTEMLVDKSENSTKEFSLETDANPAVSESSFVAEEVHEEDAPATYEFPVKIMSTVDDISSDVFFRADNTIDEDFCVTHDDKCDETCGNEDKQSLIQDVLIKTVLGNVEFVSEVTSTLVVHKNLEDICSDLDISTAPSAEFESNAEIHLLCYENKEYVAPLESENIKTGIINNLESMKVKNKLSKSNSRRNRKTKLNNTEDFKENLLYTNTTENSSTIRNCTSAEVIDSKCLKKGMKTVQFDDVIAEPITDDNSSEVIVESCCNFVNEMTANTEDLDSHELILYKSNSLTENLRKPAGIEVPLSLLKPLYNPFASMLLNKKVNSVQVSPGIHGKPLITVYICSEKHNVSTDIAKTGNSEFMPSNEMRKDKMNKVCSKRKCHSCNKKIISKCPKKVHTTNKRLAEIANSSSVPQEKDDAKKESHEKICHHQEIANVQTDKEKPLCLSVRNTSEQKLIHSFQEPMMDQLDNDEPLCLCLRDEKCKFKPQQNKPPQVTHLLGQCENQEDFYMEQISKCCMKNIPQSTSTEKRIQPCSKSDSFVEKTLKSSCCLKKEAKLPFESSAIVPMDIGWMNILSFSYEMCVRELIEDRVNCVELPTQCTSEKRNPAKLSCDHRCTVQSPSKNVCKVANLTAKNIKSSCTCGTNNANNSNIVQEKKSENCTSTSGKEENKSIEDVDFSSDSKSSDSISSEFRHWHRGVRLAEMSKFVMIDDEEIALENEELEQMEKRKQIEYEDFVICLCKRDIDGVPEELFETRENVCDKTYKENQGSAEEGCAKQVSPEVKVAIDGSTGVNAPNVNSEIGLRKWDDNLNAEKEESCECNLELIERSVMENMKQIREKRNQLLKQDEFRDKIGDTQLWKGPASRLTKNSKDEARHIQLGNSPNVCSSIYEGEASVLLKSYQIDTENNTLTVIDTEIAGKDSQKYVSNRGLNQNLYKTFVDQKIIEDDSGLLDAFRQDNISSISKTVFVPSSKLQIEKSYFKMIPSPLAQTLESRIKLLIMPQSIAEICQMFPVHHILDDITDSEFNMFLKVVHPKKCIRHTLRKNHIRPQPALITPKPIFSSQGKFENIRIQSSKLDHWKTDKKSQHSANQIHAEVKKKPSKKEVGYVEGSKHDMVLKMLQNCSENKLDQVLKSLREEEELSESKVALATKSPKKHVSRKVSIRGVEATPFAKNHSDETKVNILPALSVDRSVIYQTLAPLDITPSIEELQTHIGRSKSKHTEVSQFDSEQNTFYDTLVHTTQSNFYISVENIEEEQVEGEGVVLKSAPSDDASASNAKHIQLESARSSYNRAFTDEEVERLSSKLTAQDTPHFQSKSAHFNEKPPRKLGPHENYAANYSSSSLDVSKTSSYGRKFANNLIDITFEVSQKERNVITPENTTTLSANNDLRKSSTNVEIKTKKIMQKYEDIGVNDKFTQVETYLFDSIQNVDQKTPENVSKSVQCIFENTEKSCTCSFNKASAKDDFYVMIPNPTSNITSVSEASQCGNYCSGSVNPEHKCTLCCYENIFSVDEDVIGNINSTINTLSTDNEEISSYSECSKSLETFARCECSSKTDSCLQSLDSLPVETSSHSELESSESIDGDLEFRFKCLLPQKASVSEIQHFDVNHDRNEELKLRLKSILFTQKNVLTAGSLQNYACDDFHQDFLQMEASDLLENIAVGEKPNVFYPDVLYQNSHLQENTVCSHSTLSSLSSGVLDTSMDAESLSEAFSHKHGGGIKKKNVFHDKNPKLQNPFPVTSSSLPTICSLKKVNIVENKSFSTSYKLVDNAKEQTALKEISASFISKKGNAYRQNIDRYLIKSKENNAEENKSGRQSVEAKVHAFVKQKTDYASISRCINDCCGSEENSTSKLVESQISNKNIMKENRYKTYKEQLPPIKEVSAQETNFLEEENQSKRSKKCLNDVLSSNSDTISNLSSLKTDPSQKLSAIKPGTEFEVPARSDILLEGFHTCDTSECEGFSRKHHSPLRNRYKFIVRKRKDKKPIHKKEETVCQERKLPENVNYFVKVNDHSERNTSNKEEGSYSTFATNYLLDSCTNFGDYAENSLEKLIDSCYLRKASNGRYVDEADSFVYPHKYCHKRTSTLVANKCELERYRKNCETPIVLQQRSVYPGDNENHTCRCTRRECNLFQNENNSKLFKSKNRNYNENWFGYYFSSSNNTDSCQELPEKHGAKWKKVKNK